MLYTLVGYLHVRIRNLKCARVHVHIYIRTCIPAGNLACRIMCLCMLVCLSLCVPEICDTWERRHAHGCMSLACAHVRFATDVRVHILYICPSVSMCECLFGCLCMHVSSSPRLKIQDSERLIPTSMPQKKEPSRPAAESRTTTQAERRIPETST